MKMKKKMKKKTGKTKSKSKKVNPIQEVQNFKMSKRMWIAFAFISIGVIMIIISFFLSDPLQCNASAWSTIFTSSFTVFAIGLLFLMMGIALADVEYHNQTKWIINRHHGKRY